MTEPLSPERLAEIAARATAERLTPGPWRLDREQCDCSDGYCHHGEYVTGVITPVPTEIAAERCQRTGEKPRDYDFHRNDIADFPEADWELMVHAREDVPAMLAEIQRLDGELRFFAARVNELESQYCECTPVREHDDYKRPAAYQHAATCPVTDASITREGGDR